MTDNYRHKGLRKKLVEVIKSKGIQDNKVLEAIGNVPRHFFLDTAFADHAYENKAFPIGSGQTISHPYTVAFQSELLEVKKGQKVLEIGTGSGYQTTILCELGAKVFSIERQKELFDRTKRILKKMNYTAKLYYGDGYKGIPTWAPYDSIIVTCGAPFIPEDLLGQLKVGGRLVIPVGDESQIMTLIVKQSENEFTKKTFGDFRFVPMLEKKARD
ncbi:MAG: protein-L-isoaspartate(D-aspartate) O-methyltransferase [Flavobacteriales bacterium]